MQVIIPKSSLVKYHACAAAYSSPEWSDAKEALVYPDWSASVERMMSTPMGRSHLDWLIVHKLVPMTAAEFFEVRKIRRQAEVDAALQASKSTSLSSVPAVKGLSHG
ncbi:MAG: hypothetical protein ACRDOK_18795 [Streptosporangiaceae bacterium]